MGTGWCSGRRDNGCWDLHRGHGSRHQEQDHVKQQHGLSLCCLQSPALGTEGRGETGRRLPGSQILTGAIKYGLLQHSSHCRSLLASLSSLYGMLTLCQALHPLVNPYSDPFSRFASILQMWKLRHEGLSALGFKPKQINLTKACISF